MASADVPVSAVTAGGAGDSVPGTGAGAGEGTSRGGGRGRSGDRGRGRGRGRGGGRGRGRGGSSAASSSASEGVSDGTVRVKATSPVQKLAGAIAHTLRGGKACTVSGIGPPAINQAIKGIIQAREYLEEEGLDLQMTASVNREIGPNAIDIEVERVAARLKLPSLEAEPDFKAGSATRIAKLAGAIAARLRESSTAIHTCSAMGPTAVAVMVKAAALTETYVEDDGLKLAFVPEKIIVKVEADGDDDDGERRAMRLAVFVKSRSAPKPKTDA